MQNEKNLTQKEIYDLKKERKEQGKKKEQVKAKINTASKKTVKYLFYIVVAASAATGAVWLLSFAPKLPPISQESHSEGIPPAHILTTPMPDAIQRHMLEHADGGTRQGGVPGIIIQYNCDKYDCAPDLVQKLAELARQYPKNVYLSPNNYDGKIILTKLGKREILDEFDEQAIKDFIR